MYYRIIRNDFMKNKLITGTIMVFISISAMLVSLAAILIVNLSGSIDTLMTKAKTPHFMQMHTGEINEERLLEFVLQNSKVDEFQVAEFLNLENSRIFINENSLSHSVQDNGVAVQNKTFDYLLDLEGNVITVSPGEIYVPVSYKKDGTAKLGDSVLIYGHKFLVAGFLRDSQMNSLLASSKRFLIHEADYSQLEDVGSKEYLIEYRLKDKKDINVFEAEYTKANLEKNGPTLTYPLFQMLNAISDGIMIGVLLLVCILVVAISFMCIRFTLLAKIEEDYKEIGVLKAIGLRVTDIKKIYLAKYAVITAVSCILGIILSTVFRGKLLWNIRLTLGESAYSSYAFCFGIMGVILVFFTMIAYVNKVLKRFKKISPAQAIRFGMNQEKSIESRGFTLSNNVLLPTNVFLGLKDVFVRKKLYITMLLVFVIASFIMIVPQNLYHTIAKESFGTYMGIGQSDLRIGIMQTKGNMRERAEEIAQILSKDEYVSAYTILTTKTFQIQKLDGSIENMKIELGDHTTFPLKYAKGRAPINEDEIALSKLNADELKKVVGDTIILLSEGTKRELKVCGIYSDITNGGKTAKATFTDDSADIMWCSIDVLLSDATMIAKRVVEYKECFPYAKVSDIKEFMLQTFGPTIRSIHMVSVVSLSIALLISLFITLLFIKMLMAKDQYAIAVMKSFGFTIYDVTIQYITRSFFLLFMGVTIGVLMANTFGETLAGMILSALGASTFRFEVNVVSSYLISPLMMVCCVLIATLLATSCMGEIKISDNIKE
ncbi:FtsX-like permease family protein [Candidatus Galacturonibacter soehngenii]|uniref:ABC transporter permease n=1 Tax=Candidatus Galacturonatibacter soehngenii TaxID=2307010 RepID=A0A7V7QJ75_9FIRM|nr:ABC transporter permease [Candidatus Galacturonibacter soehngenii]KAB1435979.1 ABC transporter permease [Candidatus Galacturonibacter soehngenii]